MFSFAVEPFVPPQFAIKAATEPWERDGSYRLRRAVFCEEQRLFARDDRDALDTEAMPIVAVSLVAGMSDCVVGTVRVHESSPGRWTGSRLAIRADCRGVHGLGSALVHRAVGTASARGCSDFLATVQRPNVAFFRRLGWHVVDELDLHGMPHATMRADLARFAACDVNGETVVLARRAS